MNRTPRWLAAMVVAVGISVLTYEIDGIAQPVGQSPAPDPEALRRAEAQLLKARQELLEKEADLLKTQTDLLGKQVESMKKSPKTAKAAAALAAILDLKSAELKLSQAQFNAQRALQGARIIAADGHFIGQIGPTYDTESIFCTHGNYGATYSQNSMWCTYGKYGATYQELSPFCSYSMKPPKLVVDDTEVASVSVSGVTGQVAVSPVALRGLCSDCTSRSSSP